MQAPQIGICSQFHRNTTFTRFFYLNPHQQYIPIQIISSQMAGSPDKVSDLAQKAEYLTKTSSISPKDKDKVSQDMEQLNNTWKNYKNEEDTAIAR